MPRKMLKPPIRLRKKFAPLIELCRNKILTSPPQTTGTVAGDSIIPIVVAWGVKEGKSGRLLPAYPEGFPQGSIVSKEPEKIVVRHDCRAVLQWFHDRHYITYTAATLFAARLPVMMVLAKLELGLERSVDLLQQFDKEDIDSDE